MATAPSTTEDIQRRMAEIRRDLHNDVRDVMASAEAATDWRRYITMYPWAALGTAFAIGYFVVPRRHGAAAVAADPGIRAPIETINEERQPSSRGGWKSVAGSLWSVAGPIVIRAAQTYAAQFLENQIAQYEQRFRSEGPESGAHRRDERRR